MAWSASAIHRSMLTDTLAGTQVQDLNAPSDAYKATLWNNSITPDKDASSANSAYNAGQWANTNEQTSSTDWPAGGKAVANLAITNPSSGVVMIDGDDVASGSAATLTAYGTHVYNDTDTTPVADPGISYHYFGGAAAVTAGTLTVIWHANGLFRITV